jgi:hypothetical protein
MDVKKFRDVKEHTDEYLTAIPKTTACRRKGSSDLRNTTRDPISDGVYV